MPDKTRKYYDPDKDTSGEMLLFITDCWASYREVKDTAKEFTIKFKTGISASTIKEVFESDKYETERSAAREKFNKLRDSIPMANKICRLKEVDEMFKNRKAECVELEARYKMALESADLQEASKISRLIEMKNTLMLEIIDRLRKEEGETGEGAATTNNFVQIINNMGYDGLLEEYERPIGSIKAPESRITEIIDAEVTNVE